jgi:hypothetical protein
VKFRIAVMAAVFVACLAPSTALAGANPNNHGHHYHYGWINHRTPPATNPGPNPVSAGGGSTSSGPGAKSLIATAVPAALSPEAPSAIVPGTPELVPSGSIVTTAEPLVPGRNLWLVTILLAAAVSASVTLAVLAIGRGGHFVIRRALAPAGSTV